MHCVALSWELPFDVGNEIQGDTLRFDLGFYTEQARQRRYRSRSAGRPDFPAYAGPLSSRSTLDRVADRVTTRGMTFVLPGTTAVPAG